MTLPPPHSPLAIYQAALNDVSAAVLAGDYAAYLRRIDLPYLLSTLEADLVLHSAEDLRPTFDAVHDMLHRNGATHYERIAREAAFTRADRIEGWHFTHVIAGGQRVIAPWAARQALVLRADGWRFSEADYPFRTSTLPPTEAVLRDALRDDPAAEVPAHQPVQAAALAQARP